MEPQTTNQMMSESEQKCPWYQPLCKVTPVSKYLAMVIFILLPFVGGYVGYTYSQNSIESILIDASNNTLLPKTVGNEDLNYESKESLIDTSKPAGDDMSSKDSALPLLSVKIIRPYQEGLDLAIDQEISEVSVLADNQLVSLGQFNGRCSVRDDNSGILTIRPELRNYILTHDQIISRVYCGLMDSGREIVLYKSIGDPDNLYRSLSLQLGEGPDSIASPNTLTELKTITISQ
jgi:hypothetical protein